MFPRLTVSRWGGAGKVWTVYELACFLSPLMVDVILPVSSSL